ncbi:MAG: hypothetical protein WKG01_11600 [Kofleriaceae bacterium]
MGIMFRDAQKAALGVEATTSMQEALVTADTMVKRLETEKPGSGFREALKLDTQLKKKYETAETTQYVETFQRWCSVLASNTLNTGHDDGSTTNLEKSVDADKIVRTKDEAGDYKDKATPGLSNTPGVLNLRLVEKPNVTVYAKHGKEYHPLTIKSATISGLENQDFRSTINATPIKALRLPVVAAYTPGPHRGDLNGEKSGFVIGRNEANQYWASEEGEALSKLMAMRQPGGAEPMEAAAHILTNEIGQETVEPKKG